MTVRWDDVIHVFFDEAKKYRTLKELLPVARKLLNRDISYTALKSGSCRAAERAGLPKLGSVLGSSLVPEFTSTTLAERVRQVEDVSALNPKDGEEPIDDLIQNRIAAAKRKELRASAHTRTLEVDPTPFGILLVGDPHVDNEGCDWEALVNHINLVKKTPGVVGACVGDMQDNWIGRLQRLYADASMLASDAWRLSSWFLEQIEWIAIVGGNHDQWSHSPGVNPLKWISEKARVLCYADDEIRITIKWRGRQDLQPFVWVLRHDVSGRSWYHPTHGPHKEAMLDGHCHLVSAGHIHQWGVLTTEQRHSRITHAIRVRGYKRNDAHAKKLGFYEQSYGSSALIIIDPIAGESGKTQIFWDLETGCEYLTWLRGREQR